MEQNDKITIVVPIYNVEKYLKRCIESILKQTYENIEIVLVDDGSPDNCGKICDEYKEKDNRIIVIHKENGGLSDARNAGIDIATGKYIAFVDSDDYIASNFIACLYDICIKNECEIAQCKFKRVTGDCQEESKEISKSTILDGKSAVKEIYGQQYVYTIIACNKLYLKSLFKDIRYTKGKINEDESTTYKLLYKANKVGIIQNELYYYYQSEDSITRKKFSLRNLDYIEALEERLEFFKLRQEQGLYNLTLKKYSFTLILFYYKCKKFLPDTKNIQKELMKKFRKSVKEIRNTTNISIKAKLVLSFACVMPYVYSKIFIKI